MAAAQFECAAGDVVGNVAVHVALTEQAGSLGVELLVFPELSLTGYELELIATRRDLTCSVDDARLDPLLDVAARTEVTLVVGAPVSLPAGRALAALVISPHRPGIQACAKSHLHGREPGLFVSGVGPAVIDVATWRVGLGICFDAAVPEHAATARSLGADVYAVGALYTVGQERRLADHMSDRARHNGLYAVLGQHVGSTGVGAACGGAGVWGPDGSPMTQLGAKSTGIAVADLAPLAQIGTTQCPHASGATGSDGDRPGAAGVGTGDIR